MTFQLARYLDDSSGVVTGSSSRSDRVPLLTMPPAPLANLMGPLWETWEKLVSASVLHPPQRTYPDTALQFLEVALPSGCRPLQELHDFLCAGPAPTAQSHSQVTPPHSRNVTADTQFRHHSLALLEQTGVFQQVATWTTAIADKLCKGLHPASTADLLQQVMAVHTASLSSKRLLRKPPGVAVSCGVTQ